MKPSGPSLFAALLVLTCVSTARAALVARWSFDETGGTTAADSVSGFDGTLEGGATFVPAGGIRGGAVHLDYNTGDLVDVGDHLAFTGNDTFSIQAWIKTTETEGNVVVGRHRVTIVAGYWLGINNTGDGGANEVDGSFHLYQSDVPQLSSGARNLNDGNWHQIVAVRDGAAGELRLYADGARVPSGNATGTLVSLAATNAPFLIGGVLIGDAKGSSYKGLLDEVRVWDNALTDADVSYFFQHPDSASTDTCGDANANASITAADALFALRTAVGSTACLLCVCDANDSGSVTASDALVILKKAVGQDVPLTCPECVAGNLEGLRWELPCTDDGNPACSCQSTFTTSATMLGTAGTHYDVTLRFRGVVEQKSYTGGTQDGLFLTGGTPAVDGYNVYKLQVSSPAATYYLNAGTSNVQRCWELDATEIVPIDAGATVTLTGDASDGQEITNTDGTNPIVPPGVPPAPDSFHGQFIQIDVVSVATAP